jgi:hypothetical protein
MGNALRFRDLNGFFQGKPELLADIGYLAGPVEHVKILALQFGQKMVGSTCRPSFYPAADACSRDERRLRGLPWQRGQGFRDVCRSERWGGNHDVHFDGIS